MSKNLPRNIPKKIPLHVGDRRKATLNLLSHLERIAEQDKKLSISLNQDKIEGVYNGNIKFRAYFSDEALEWNMHLKQNNGKSRKQVETLDSYLHSYNPHS